jgi:hypothetical protein
VTAAAVVFALTPDDAQAWLELVDTDGPFLSVPVLRRAWSAGMPPPGVQVVLRKLLDELDTFDSRAREDGVETLDATHLTWHRLLATSRALYSGASFEDIRLPSYGGSLFDPARFAFLTTRDEHGTLAVAVSDWVMLEVLRAVQMAKLPGEPARRISFRDTDVEQIGYIYEGMLGYSCQDVKEITVGLIGKEGEEPEIPLATPEISEDGSRVDVLFVGWGWGWVRCPG